jgi:hypothetical protein
MGQREREREVISSVMSKTRKLWGGISENLSYVEFTARIAEWSLFFFAA